MANNAVPDAEGEEPEEEPLLPSQWMGLSGLLRVWRSQAGHRKGLGRALSQEEVAEAINRSVRWYRALEGGGVLRMDRDVLDALASVLMLGRAERVALRLHALGGGLPGDDAVQRDAVLLDGAQVLLDKQMPSPAYLCNHRWDVIAHNQAMADFYPWVRDPGVNLLRWALLSDDARRQYVAWHDHAADYMAMLRLSLIRHPSDVWLTRLLGEVLADPECRKIWEADPRLLESQDGLLFRMSLPENDFDEGVEVLAHVLYPASLTDCRMVILTWWINDDPQ